MPLAIFPTLSGFLADQLMAKVARVLKQGTKLCHPIFQLNFPVSDFMWLRTRDNHTRWVCS